MRLTRSGMLEVLSADYIRTAYAKGFRPLRVLFKHALNAVIQCSFSICSIWAYAVRSYCYESVFAMQGIGYLARINSQNDIAK